MTYVRTLIRWTPEQEAAARQLWIRDDPDRKLSFNQWLIRKVLK